jgi:type IV pilus assembly protein PilM
VFNTRDSTVGLDLGTTGARAVEVVWRANRPVVERWAAVDFPAPVSDWRNTDVADMARLVGDITVRKGMRGRWVAHSVSGDAAAPQYFNFPQLMPEDVPEAVRIEAEAALPFKADDAMISYILFPEQRLAANKVRTHGLAIAADGKVAESRLLPIRAAGLETFCLETDATACTNAYIATRAAATEEQGTTAILNIGSRYSNLAILGPDHVLMVRDLPWAGEHMTLAISKLLSVPLVEAEALKRKHWEGGPAAAGALDDRMIEALRKGAQEFVGRLHDTVHYWSSERLVPTLTKLLVTGGGSQVRGLPEFFAEDLQVPVERWAPFGLSCPGVSGAGEVKTWDNRMTVAFGLALREFSLRK